MSFPNECDTEKTSLQYGRNGKQKRWFERFL